MNLYEKASGILEKGGLMPFKLAIVNFPSNGKM